MLVTVAGWLLYAACQCFSAFSLSHPFGLVESRTAVTPAGDVEEGGCEVAAGEAHFTCCCSAGRSVRGFTSMSCVIQWAEISLLYGEL